MDIDRDDQLRKGVKKAYSRAAEKPYENHPFPVGREFAESLGYPKELLNNIPHGSIDSFTGVSNVSVFAHIPVDSIILDLGCGAGLDALIAARKTGPSGMVIGIDFSSHMLNRARQSAAEAGLENVTFCFADAEFLPLKKRSIDIVLTNGIFNLNTNRQAIFNELGRVVRSGGCVYAAELILKEASSKGEQLCEANWFG
jgi:SAM-dependent methyltransferase